MKLFKSSILALLACSAVAMVSCDGGKDADYVDGAQSNGAYFATSAPLYSVKDDATSFTIPVDRPSKESPSTVNLTVSDPSGLFGIPNTVTFADDALTASIEITYDATEMDYDKKYPVSITIEGANNYGVGEYSFSIMRPAPWTTLEGYGLYTDELIIGLYDVEQLTYKVTVQESDLTPGLYRIVSPYAAGVYPYTSPKHMISTEPYYMVIHAEKPDLVYFETFCTNMEYSPDAGVMSFCCRVGYLLENNPGTTVESLARYCGYNDNGVIYLPTETYFFGTGTAFNGGPYGPLGTTGGRLVLPGVEINDYSAKIDYKGRFTDTNEETTLIADITLGDDVEYARVAASTTSDPVALQQGIENGEIESIEIKESGEVRIPITEGGINTIMVVTYADGEAQNVSTIQVEVALGGSEWENIGEAIILDGWLIGASGLANSYDKYYLYCEAQRSTKRPGFYRLLQPWGPNALYGIGDAAVPGIYNIQINAEDPKNVYIEPQSTGNNLFKEGVITIATEGYFNNLPDNLRGVLEDGEFIFPATTCLFSFAPAPDDWYYTRKEGRIHIDALANSASTVSYKAVKDQKSVGTALQRMNAVPYNSSYVIPRYRKFEKANL